MVNSTITIIEDDQTTILLLKSILEELHYTVLPAVDSSETPVEKIIESNPDLLLVDINLNGERDGIDIVTQIQKHIFIPVIYVTAHNDYAAFQKAKLTNPYGFINKPVRKNELMIIIETALQRFETEKKLKESETNNLALIQTIPYGIAEIDHSGSIVFSNRQHDALYGYKEGEMRGMKVLDLIKSDSDRKELQSYFEMIITQNVKPEPLFTKVLNTNNETLDIEVNWNYKYDTSGTMTGIISVITDITERKKNEDELRQFSLAIETTLDPVIIINLEGAFTYCNRAAEITFEYTQEELIGQNISIIDPFPEKQTNIIIPEIIHREALTGEVIGVTKSGARIPFTITSNLIKNKQGTPIGIMEVLHNTSKQKEFEIHLKKELNINTALAQLSSAIIRSDFTIDNICSIVLEHAKQLTESKHGYVSTIDETGVMTVHTFTAMMDKECKITGPDQKIEFPVNPDGTYNALWGHSLNIKKPFFTNTPQKHEKSSGIPQGHITLTNFLSVPVLSDDILLGQVSLANSERDYTDSDIVIIKSLSDLFAISIQHSAFQKELKQAKENLEKKVEQRTAELVQANKKLVAEIDDRISAEKALIASEEKFKTVADFTYDWETWIDINGNYIYMSPSCERMTGYSRQEFFQDQKLIMNIIHPEDKPLFETHLEEILNTPHTEYLDFRLITRDGKIIWISHRCQPVYNSNGEWLGQRGSNRDITERKKTEDALKRSERNASALLNASKNIIFMINSKGIIVTTNEAAAAHLEIKEQEIVNKHISDFIPTFLPEEITEYIDKAFTTKKIIEFDTEYNDFIYNYQVYPILTEKNTVDRIALYARDITIIRKLENEIIRTSEEERRTIGQDLHDGLGQDLTALTFQVEKLYNQMRKENDPHVETILTIQNNIRDAIIKTRSLAKFLSPFNIENSGLIVALEEMCERIKNVFAVTCRLEKDESFSIQDNQVAQHLYYIAREAINNSVKHGNPSEIKLFLRTTEHSLLMIIEDNGTGIQPGKKHEGMGIAIMQHRAKIIGGNFSAGNMDKNGFYIKVDLKKR